MYGRAFSATACILICLALSLQAVAPADELAVEREIGADATHEGLAQGDALPELASVMEGWFIRNAGQVPNEEVMFYAPGSPMSVGLAPDGLILTITEARLATADIDGARSIASSRTTVLRMLFAGAGPVEPVGAGAPARSTSFLRGSDRSGWLRAVESYPEVLYPDIYEGISMRCYFKEGQFKYDVVLAPGASLDEARFSYSGAEGLSIDGATGDLLIRTASGVIRDARPVAWQPMDGVEQDMPVEFVLLGESTWGFRLPGGHDAGLPLVIDPGLQYSTYLGGSGYDGLTAIEVDDDGYVYASGGTYSFDFPATPGTYDNVSSGFDFFLVKLEPDLSGIVFSTFIGPKDGIIGDSWNVPGLFVLGDGSILMVIYTYVEDFPTTPDALDPTYNGGEGDIVIAVVTADGSDISYATYLGGSERDSSYVDRLDASEALYITGDTKSPDLPTTPGAFCSTHGGGIYDGWVAKLERPYTQLTFLTYFGGSGDDILGHFDLDAQGDLFLGGWTTSNDFPVTQDAYQSTLKGGREGFLTQMHRSGTKLVHSTLFGGSGWDETSTVHLLESGAVASMGWTTSDDLPVTSDAADKTFNGTDDMTYIEFDTDWKLDHCTYIGGSGLEWCGAATLDKAAGVLYNLGYSTSPDFPTTPGCYDPEWRGGGQYGDAVVLVYNVTARAIEYSSYFGDKYEEVGMQGKCIELMGDGTVYCTGISMGPDFPTTTGAYSTVYSGGAWDSWVLRLDPRPVDVPPAPTGLKAAQGDSQLAVSWDTSTDESYRTLGYRLYTGTSPDDIGTLIEPGGVLTSYLHTGLTNGVRQYYQVSAVNSMGEGPRSAIVSEVPMGLPTAPLGLVAETGDGNVTLTWLPPQDLRGGTLVGYDVLKGETVGAMQTIASLGPVDRYVDAAVTTTRSYFYAVAARNERGPGAWSDVVFVKVQEPPGEPTDLVATAGVSSVMLSWGRPVFDGGATIVGYRVYRGTSAGELALLAHRLPTELFYQDTAVTNGVAYYYAVSAFTGVGEGNRTGPVPATPRGPPDAPAGLVARALDAQVRLEWGAPASDGGAPVTAYRVVYGTSPGSLPSAMDIGPVATATVGGLDNGVTYYFMLTAINEIGEGLPTDVVSATPYGVPGAPTALVGVAQVGGIGLSWRAPSDFGEAETLSYRVLRGTTGDLEPIGLVADATSYFDASAAAGTTYTYRVAALNEVNEGAPSDPVTVLMPDVPGAPVGLTAVVAGREVTLRWSPPAADGGSSVRSYVVLRGFAVDEMEEIATIVATEYRDPEVAYGQTYHYSVRAVNAAGAGPMATPLVVTPLPPPSAPGALKVELSGDDVTISWAAPAGDSANVTGYYVMRGPSGDRLVIIAEVGDVLTYTDKGVERGRTYYYSVVARSDAGEGEPATPVKLTVGEGMDPMVLVVVILVIVVVLLLAVLLVRGRKGRPDEGTSRENE